MSQIPIFNRKLLLECVIQLVKSSDFLFRHQKETRRERLKSAPCSNIQKYPNKLMEINFRKVTQCRKIQRWPFDTSRACNDIYWPSAWEVPMLTCCVDHSHTFPGLAKKIEKNSHRNSRPIFIISAIELFFSKILS